MLSILARNAMELKEARRKHASGESLSHHECLLLYTSMEMSTKEFCEKDICLTERWFEFLKLMRKEKPGTEADAVDFLAFISEYTDDLLSEDNFWIKGFDMHAIFNKHIQLEIPASRTD